MQGRLSMYLLLTPLCPSIESKDAACDSSISQDAVESLIISKAIPTPKVSARSSLQPRAGKEPGGGRASGPNDIGSSWISLASAHSLFNNYKPRTSTHLLQRRHCKSAILIEHDNRHVKLAELPDTVTTQC